MATQSLAKHMVFAGRPLLYADSGIENINTAVDATLFSACLERVLAQVDVAYSNSMIEAFWRSLKHQWNKARAERLAANRAMTCDQCSDHPVSSPTSQIPP